MDDARTMPVTAATMPVLETPRLHLEPYADHHLDPMAEMFGDPEVTAFTYLGRQDRAGTARVLAGYRSFFDGHGFGMFAVLDRETGTYFGEAGLFVPPIEAAIDLLALRYALNRAAWGKGFATEASGAVIEDAFGRLDRSELIAGVVRRNVPSVRVMERLEFVRGGEVTTGAHTYDLYTLRRENWRLRSG